VGTDPAFLLQRQYRTAENLATRIGFHERFSTNREPFPRWVFDRLPLESTADVLDVGCGNGNLWYANRDRIPPALRLTLTDFSPGMVEEARVRLGSLATYRVADVQQLPFVDASFDLVVANHMLFHVPDRRRALRELSRMLRPGGVVVATTNGRNHLRELGTAWTARWSRTFGLENGPVQLARHFKDVHVELFPGSLEVTEVDPLIDYVRSLVTPATDDGLARLAAAAEASIARCGSFHVTTATGLIRARKP
jgi:SAM-dependent methyltransferase